MTNDISKYLSGDPKKENFLKSVKNKGKRLIFSIVFIFKSHENSLPVPELNIPWEKNNWTITNEAFDVVKEVYQSAEDRKNKLEDKAQKIFGIATFFIPIILGTIIYLLENYLLENFLNYAILTLIIISIVFYLLAMYGCLTAIRVREVQSPGLSLFIDPSTDQMLNTKKEQIAACLLFCSQHNQRMNDYIANYIKSSETFIFTAILCTILSGVGWLLQ